MRNDWNEGRQRADAFISVKFMVSSFGSQRPTGTPERGLLHRLSRGSAATMLHDFPMRQIWVGLGAGVDVALTGWDGKSIQNPRSPSHIPASGQMSSGGQGEVFFRLHGFYMLICWVICTTISYVHKWDYSVMIKSDTVSSGLGSIDFLEGEKWVKLHALYLSVYLVLN